MIATRKGGRLTVIAAALVARGGAPAAELERHLDSMRRLVESWRSG